MQLRNKFKGNRKTIAEVTNMTLLGYFYIAKILPEPEVVRLCIYHIKKLALVCSFQSTNFHSHQIIDCKDINVMAISRICVYFRNRKCYRKNVYFPLKSENNEDEKLYSFSTCKMSVKVSQNFAVFAPEKMSFVPENNPESPRMVSEKYGIYV